MSQAVRLKPVSDRVEKPAFFINPEITICLNLPAAQNLVNVLLQAATVREIEFSPPVFAFMKTLESELKEWED